MLTTHFKNSYAWNANLQVSQQLAKNDALTFSYVMTSGRNMQFLRNNNLKNDPAYTQAYLADGRPVYNGSASATTRVLYNQSAQRRRARQHHPDRRRLQLLLQRLRRHLPAPHVRRPHHQRLVHLVARPLRYSRRQHLPVQQRRGRSSNPFRDRGNSNINRPNAFTFSTVYSPKASFENKIVNALANGNELAVLGNFLSGDALSLTSSNRLNGDGTATSRPLFVQRNTLRSPNVYQVDAPLHPHPCYHQGPHQYQAHHRDH